MGNFQIFTTGLMVISLLTGLVTEAIKKIMEENGKTYKANTLAGIVSVVMAPATCAFYAVVGYDKVVQTFAQFKVKEDESKK